MECKKCNEDKPDSEFYAKDRTCKECRKEMVRKNRERNKDYYREYDRKRFKEDPRVKARHKKYQQTEAYKESMKKSREKWLCNNQNKRAAHMALYNAVRDGRVVKKYECECCGATGCRIHGHHDDYAMMLTVRWLCSKCHYDWHRENGEAKNAR